MGHDGGIHATGVTRAQRGRVLNTPGLSHPPKHYESDQVSSFELDGPGLEL